MQPKTRQTESRGFIAKPLMIGFLGIFCLLAVTATNAPGQSPMTLAISATSAVISDPQEAGIFYAVDQLGVVTKRSEASGDPLWVSNIPALPEVQRAFSIDVSSKFHLLAYCGLQPIAGKILVRTFDTATGQLFATYEFNQNAAGELLASCTHLHFDDTMGILLFNDVARIHRLSLRLGKLTHVYRGAERHQVSHVSPNQNALVALSDSLSTWNLLTGALTRRQAVIVPGYSQWGLWDREAAISDDLKLGLVVACEDRGKSTIAWINMASGLVLRSFDLNENAVIAKIKFVSNTRALVLINNHVYDWSIEQAQPTTTPLPDFLGLSQSWYGHEDVAINIVINQPVPNIPTPPYPPEYEAVMTAHAFPLAFDSSLQKIIVSYCCDSAGFHWLDLSTP